MYRVFLLFSLLSILLTGCTGESTAPKPDRNVESKIRAAIAKLDRSVEPIPGRYKDEKKLAIVHEKTTKHESTDGQVRTEFQLRIINPCADELRFHGYTESSPIYCLQTRSEDGSWHKQGLGWCGTGMRDCFILKGESAKFAVSSYERMESIKIGIDYGDGKTLWSDAIRF